MNRIGTATTTGMTLRALGMRCATGMRTLVRPVGALGMRTLRTLGSLGVRTLRTLRAVGSFRRCHIYLVTGNSIRGSRVLGF